MPDTELEGPALAVVLRRHSQAVGDNNLKEFPVTKPRNSQPL